jgi:cytochrome P450
MTSHIQSADADAPGTCPMHAVGDEFKPFSSEYQRDPWPFFDRAREQEPVFYSDEVQAYVVTRFEDVSTVLRDPETFSANNVLDFITPPCPAATEKLVDSGFVPGGATVNEDDDEHRAHRDALRPAFSKQRLAELEPKIRAWCTEYVDAFVKRGEADLVREYMYEIPALVTFEIIGVPKEEIPRVKQFAVARSELNFGRATEEEQVELATGFGEFYAWTVGHVERLTREPGDSFWGELVQRMEEPGMEEVLDRTWVNRMCTNLLFAGHETTTNGAGNAFRLLLENPEQYQRLVDDPSLIRNSVDETLRLHSTTPLWRRVTTKDVELGGAKIPAGSQVFMAFGSANHDEDRFPEADKLDVARPDARDHLSFGWGRHKCVGAALARLEISIAVEELTTRLPHLRLKPGQTFEYPRNILFRGPHSVVAEWDPAQNPRPEDRP